MKQQSQGNQATQAYAYDGQSQLIAAQTANPEVKTAVAHPARVWRYHYDRNGNRVLAQENVPVTEMGQTRTASYSPDSNALITPPDLGRETVWNAQGQLIAIRQENRELARYRYNHRGLRVGKQTGTEAAHTLYNEQRQRIADLDSQGKITRQYLWLGDHLIATLDAAAPKALQAPADGFIAELTQTVSAMWNSATGNADRLAFVHVNHLGAPIPLKKWKILSNLAEPPLFTPILRFDTLADLNAWLEIRCAELAQRPHPTWRARSIAELFAEEQSCLRPITVPFDGYFEQTNRVSSTCLVSYDRTLPSDLLTISSPVLHNETRSIPFALWGVNQDREVRYPVADAPSPLPNQRDAPIEGLTYSDSLTWITRDASPTGSREGVVDMTAYGAWLQANYGINLQ